MDSDSDDDEDTPELGDGGSEGGEGGEGQDGIWSVLLADGAEFESSARQIEAADAQYLRLVRRLNQNRTAAQPKVVTVKRSDGLCCEQPVAFAVPDVTIVPGPAAVRDALQANRALFASAHRRLQQSTRSLALSAALIAEAPNALGLKLDPSSSINRPSQSPAGLIGGGGDERGLPVDLIGRELFFAALPLALSYGLPRSVGELGGKVSGLLTELGSKHVGSRPALQRRLLRAVIQGRAVPPPPLRDGVADALAALDAEANGYLPDSPRTRFRKCRGVRGDAEGAGHWGGTQHFSARIP